ncbi:MAG: RNase H-like domain-containing protein [Sedimenticola sp.]
MANRVQTVNSPTFSTFYNQHPVHLTCDSGATSSLIRRSIAIKIQAPISKTKHTASQADGKTQLNACGEVNITLCRGDLKFNLQAVVVEDLDCDILAGMPFMKHNNIVLDIPKDRLVVNGKHSFPYQNSTAYELPTQIRRTRFLLRADNSSVILPGDFVEISTPNGLPNDTELAVEPRFDSPLPFWPKPVVTQAVDGFIRLDNSTSEPITLHKNQHLAHLIPMSHTAPPPRPHQCVDTDNYHDYTSVRSVSTDQDFCAPIVIDPDSQLSLPEKQLFHDVNRAYSGVFDPIIGKYNDFSGKIRAYINMGPVDPPPQKGRLPMYNHKNLDLLQEKMDQLESLGVLAKPEDVDVTVEYVSPSFLVKKPDGGHRLVTAFNTIGSYAKPTPSRVTTSENVFQFLAKSKFIIKTDMTKQFFQLPMKKNCMKYLGVMTPFKGTRVYTRAAMGMPGSTEQLDELMYRVLGDLFHNGAAIKIADDLYVGGCDLISLLHNWESVLQKFQSNNLRLSASKTVICPINTTILGWIWSAGSIQASPHKVNPLVTCPQPTSVKALRSWIGAFKHLKACIPQYSSLLADLESYAGGKDSSEKIEWTDSLSLAFQKAQQALSNPRNIVIPRPSDQLVITNDGAVRNGGIGSVLYVLRDGKMLLGGYVSAKLKTHQNKWLPCEVEALAISSALNHWASYILESSEETQVLTDSKPCIQRHLPNYLGESFHQVPASQHVCPPSAGIA